PPEYQKDNGEMLPAIFPHENLPPTHHRNVIEQSDSLHVVINQPCTSNSTQCSAREWFKKDLITEAMIENHPGTSPEEATQRLNAAYVACATLYRAHFRNPTVRKAGTNALLKLHAILDGVAFQG